MAAAETILRKLIEKIIKQPYNKDDVSFQALNSGGANYTSALYSVIIPSDNGNNLKLFAKVANINGKLREVMNVKTLFDTEQFLYKELAESYKKLQDKHNIAPEHRYSFPKFYGGNDDEGEETVILENLIDKGYSPYSRFKAIDWEHAACAVECLARFHALSFAFEKEEPENFTAALEIVKLRYTYNRDDPVMKETWLKMMGSAIQVAKEEHKEKVSAFLLRELLPEEIMQSKMPLGTPVLCHGDYRVSNLLFRRQNDRLETIVVDYQTLHSGSPAIDLLYLEFMGTNEEFRREHHERLKDHYFGELTLALDRLGVDVNEVYPRETFDSEYKVMLPVAFRSASFILPLVLVEVDRAPQMAGCKVEDFVISPNELFAERFSGLISDCVR